jgi:hypothetical protein
VSAAAQPLVVVTEWGARGAVLLGLLLLVLGFAALIYRYVLARSRPPPFRATIAIAAAGLLAAFFSPILFSSDVYAYAAYGELARLGANPYAFAPSSLAKDALISAAAWQWSGTLPICVYGPAFVALAKAFVVLLAPLGMLAQLNGLRAAASVSFLLCGPLAFVAYTGSRSARLRSVATILLNPAAIWCAAEGHNDAIALCVVLAGFALVRRRLGAAGAFLAALAALIKLPGAAAAAGLSLVDRRARIGAIAGLAIAAAFSVPLFAGVATQLAPRGHYAPQASLQAVFAPLGLAIALPAAAVVATVLVAAGTRRLRREQPDGWVWVGLGAWMLVPNPYPWYGLWLLALAAIAPQSRGGRAAVLLSLTALLRYAPDAIAMPPAGPQVALGLLATLPLVALLPRRRHRFFARPVIMSDP